MPMNDLDYDKPFQGLSLREWLKVVFYTRARMLRQNDAIIDRLMQLNAQAQANTEAALKLADARFDLLRKCMDKMTDWYFNGSPTAAEVGEIINLIDAVSPWNDQKPTA